MAIPRDILSSIQIDYQRNLQPREIAEKYGYTAKQVTDLAYRYNWSRERKEKNSTKLDKIRQRLESADEAEIAKIKADGRLIALNTLVEVMSDETAKNSDRVNAANGFLKVTGDLTQTQNIKGNIQQSTRYVLPEEWEEVNKHIENFINN